LWCCCCGGSSSTVVHALAATTTFLVTGANGFIGRAVVHALLQEQQEKPVALQPTEILCLVRKHRVADEAAYWQQHQQQQQQEETQVPPTDRSRIRVLPYDMIDGGTSLRAALDEWHRSCDNGSSQQQPPSLCVYHVASVFGPTENPRATAHQNVQGTRDLFVALDQQWRTVPNSQVDEQRPACRVVLTSSMAAVRGTGQDPGNGEYYTAEDWNSVSTLADDNWGACYQWSKMESERQAWQLSQELDIPLTVLCPSFVFGPPYGDGGGASYAIQLVRQWMSGASAVQSRLLVDIRDVAAAHVQAGRTPDSRGQRYLVSTEARVPSRELADWIRQAVPLAHATRERIHADTTYQGGAIPIGQREVKASERLYAALGVRLRPVQETIQDMTRELLRQEEDTSRAETSETP
jgi:nucleoside-diphosphate-sugar epimerase